MIQYEDLPVNGSGEQQADSHVEDTVERYAYGKKNPYVMVAASLFKDTSISLQCKGLIGYLLTHAPGWKISVKQVINLFSQHHGKSFIYKLFQEGIKAGYIKRVFTYFPGPKPRTTIRRCSYFVSDFPEFKDENNKQPEDEPPTGCKDQENTKPVETQPDVACEQHATEKCVDSGCRLKKCGDSRCGDTGCRLTFRNILSYSLGEEYEEEKKKINKKENHSESAIADTAASAACCLFSPQLKKVVKKRNSEFSPEVVDVANQMVAALLANKPNYVPPRNMKNMLTQVDNMLHLDKRDASKIISVLKFALDDDFWVEYMFADNPAAYLRKKFDRLDKQMNKQPKRKGFAPCSNPEAMDEAMEYMKKGAIS